VNLWPFFATLLIIAAAELGDKTQLLTLGFAAKYPAKIVLAAVSLATALLMGMAVLLGGLINQYIPAFYLQLMAGLIFIAFGLMTLLGKAEKEKSAANNHRDVFFFVFVTFFLAELGDKTELAAFVLSAKYGAPLQVWLGATLGMIGVNLIALAAGSWVKKMVAEKTLRWIGALIFLGFGAATLIRL
jgi:putative Ca2+/H+ antiporter (TMEM165/GDT1 family)